jgi:hypothetical protein
MRTVKLAPHSYDLVTGEIRRVPYLFRRGGATPLDK